MSTDLNIKSKDQLIRKIIRDCPDNMGELSETQIYDIFEYLVKSRIESPKLKEEVIDFLTSRTSYIPNKLKEPVRDYLVDTARETAIDDFYVYAKLMASSVLPNDFVDGRHIKVICRELQRVYESIGSTKPTRRSMFFLPPGAMKTVLCSIIFPSWVLGKHPNWQVIAVGYTDDFAADKIGDPLKQLMTTPQYKDLFPDTIIRSDSKSKDRFQTTKKGEFKALGAKARAAGRRAHLLLVDDAVSEQDAFSPQKRGEINKNYIGGLRSRLMRTPRGAEVIVNTRWHLADLSGYLLETDKKSKRPWNVICIPAILDDKPTTRIDGVNLTPEQLLRESSDPPTLYTPGTSFWPEFQPMEILEEERESLMVTEPHKWYALYMQALDINTPIPTPSGWSTVGELKVGDFVLGADGKPTKIKFKTDVFKNRECYEVATKDGHSVVADKNHLWKTKVWRNDEPWKVVTTEFLATRFAGREGRHPRIPVSEAWVLPKKDLPVDPYILGVWLGDGNTNQAVFTAEENDGRFYVKEFGKLGLLLKKLKTKYSYSSPGGLQKKLRELGVLGNKHIPEAYLRSSKEQRLSLLQGLMDTDGTCQNGRAQFANTNSSLVKQVEELVFSLGGKPTITSFEPKKGKTCFKVCFYLEDCFRLPRKKAKCRKAKSKHYRFLKLKKVERRDTQCITVDAEDGLFLAGRGCLVTHNCPVAQDGGIVKHTDWKWWDIDDEGNPQVTHVIASIDTAFTDTKRADFSAYTVWGVFYPEKNGPPHLILLAAQKGKWLWPDLVARISDVHKTFKPDFMVIEKKASGQSLLQDLYRKGYPVVEYETKSSKEERLQSASMWFRQGRIWVPMDREWALDLVDEVCNFPSAAHDDLTDTTSQAIVWYRDMSIMEHEEDKRDDEDEDDYDNYREPTSTYWGAMLNAS